MNSSVWALLAELSKKSGVSDIMINSPEQIYIERNGQIIQLNAKVSESDIDTFVLEVAKINQKLCDNNNPILDGKLPDGSRINIINKPFVDKHPAISIRKFQTQMKTFETNPDLFGLGPRWITLLQAMVKAKMNIVVSGGTGAGKTTLLNALIHEIPKSERLITIEDTLELTIYNPNVVRLESRGKDLASMTSLSTRDLVKNTLRMRPDRIIIGESRGPELFDLIQAMNTGHDGSLTTIHANSAGECMMRMEMLYMLSGFDMPIMAIRKHISTVINFVFQIQKDKNGQRVIQEIVEFTGMEGSAVLMQSIAKREDGYLKFSGMVPYVMEDLISKAGLPNNFFNDF